MLERLQDDMVAVDPEHRLKREPPYGVVFTKKLLGDVRRHRGFVLVAETAHSPAGMLAGWVSPVSRIDRLEHLPYRTGFVSELVVLPGFRRRGIGSQLLSEAERRFKTAGCDTVSLYVFGPNRVARRLYRHLGYSVHSLRLGKRIAPPPES